MSIHDFIPVVKCQTTKIKQKTPGESTHSIILVSSLGVLWFLFLWCLLNVLTYMSCVYTMYVCLCMSTYRCVYIYHTLQCILYFLFQLNSLFWGSFHVSAYRFTSVFLIEERCMSTTETYLCPPPTQFPSPEAVPIISVLCKLPELYGACISILLYSSIFYTALHLAFFAWTVYLGEHFVLYI